MAYFRCGGGETPIEFTKTSIIDTTQLPTLAFNADYTTYDLLLVVCSNSNDGTTSEFLTTPEMLTEIFTYSVSGYGAFAMFNRGSSNHYVSYKKVSNTQFDRYNYRYLEVTNVYAVTCNKTITKTDIYKRGALANTTVAINTVDDILDNDLILMSCTNGNASETTVCDTHLNLMNEKGIFNVFVNGWTKYNTGMTMAFVSEHDITAGYYFMCQGIKFS